MPGRQGWRQAYTFARRDTMATRGAGTGRARQWWLSRPWDADAVYHSKWLGKTAPAPALNPNWLVVVDTPTMHGSMG
jgi:hypothetical protein